MNVISVSDTMQNKAVFLSPILSNSRSSSSISCRTSLMSNGANRAPQLIKIDFAVLPVAVCQGLFNLIYKMFTKPHQPGQKMAISPKHRERSLTFHKLPYFVLKHPLDFVLHCLGAGFAEMRPYSVGDISDLLHHCGRRCGTGCSVGYDFGFVTHSSPFV